MDIVMAVIGAGFILYGLTRIILNPWWPAFTSVSKIEPLSDVYHRFDD